MRGLGVYCTMEETDQVPASGPPVVTIFVLVVVMLCAIFVPIILMVTGEQSPLIEQSDQSLIQVSTLVGDVFAKA